MVKYNQKKNRKIINSLHISEKNILENSDCVFLKEDIQRPFSSTKLFLSDKRGQRYTDLKKVNFFVGLPVAELYRVVSSIRALQ